MQQLEGGNANLVVEATAKIVSSYLANNHVNADAIPSLIQLVAKELNIVTVGAPAVQEREKTEPAVPIRKSINPDFIVDLFTGKKFKSLKRHLRTVHNMTPEQYREHWGLPKDYPMVAPNYAKARSDLAKQMGLGVGGRKAKADKAAAAVAAAAPKPAAKAAKKTSAPKAAAPKAAPAPAPAPAAETAEA